MPLFCIQKVFQVMGRAYLRLSLPDIVTGESQLVFIAENLRIRLKVALAVGYPHQLQEELPSFLTFQKILSGVSAVPGIFFCDLLLGKIYLSDLK
jgi:hypothetical protein